MCRVAVFASATTAVKVSHRGRLWRQSSGRAAIFLEAHRRNRAARRRTGSSSRLRHRAGPSGHARCRSTAAVTATCNCHLPNAPQYCRATRPSAALASKAGLVQDQDPAAARQRAANGATRPRPPRRVVTKLLTLDTRPARSRAPTSPSSTCAAVAEQTRARTTAATRVAPMPKQSLKLIEPVRQAPKQATRGDRALGASVPNLNKKYNVLNSDHSSDLTGNDDLTKSY